VQFTVPDRRAKQYLIAAAVLVVLFNALLLIWILAEPVNHTLYTAVDNLAQAVGPLLVLPLCFAWRIQAGAGSRQVSRAQLWAPRLLGLGVLADVIAQAIWNYYTLILGQPTPFPSWADAAFLSVYPLLLAGILLLLRRPAPAASRARLALDGLMVMTAAVTFSWYFVLGPTLYQGEETVFAKTVGTAYPVMDLLLIVCLVMLAGRSRDATLRPAIILLSLGIACYIVGDSIFDSQTLHNTYATGEWIDVSWPLADMLLVLGAGVLRFRLARETAESGDGGVAAPAEQAATEHTRLWPSMIPYALVPVVGGLLIYVFQVQGDEPFQSGVYVGSAVLVGLLLFRQLLAIVENAHLSTRLQTKNRELIAANRRLEALATTDPLTGLPNHRALMSGLDAELERAQRYHRPCSLIFLDIDHFKALNDTWGHPAGDAALQEVAAVARRALRSIDVLGRLGGEEFLAILPETENEAALQAAERVRATVAAHVFSLGDGAHLTCSLGVATYPNDAEGRDELIELADRAMYAAKTLGRNQARYITDAGVVALVGDRRRGGARDEAALMGTVEALAALIDARDNYTGQHTREVAGTSMRIALAIGLNRSEARMIGLAARLHDIGKVAVPDAVLRKPGRLGPDEWALIRMHPIVGADVVRRVPALRTVAPIIRGHHERWDGRGYPDGLKATAIPLGARIVSVADAFAAMTANRPYCIRMSPEAALAELCRCAGTQFDASAVDALVRVLEADMEVEQQPEAV
jgi:diguanylate cyclase (GGDEF)-like protein